MLPAANVKLGTVGLFSYDKTESERKMVITKKSMIKRKFSDNSRPPIRSADDDGVFDFDGSQSTTEYTYYSDTSGKIVNPSCNSESTKVHRSSKFPLYDSESTFSEYGESEISFNMADESPRCYICSNNNMVLANGAIRDWIRKASTELLKQQGKMQYAKCFKYGLRCIISIFYY